MSLTPAEKFLALTESEQAANANLWHEHLQWMLDHAAQWGIKLTVKFTTPDGATSTWKAGRGNASERQ